MISTKFANDSRWPDEMAIHYTASFNACPTVKSIKFYCVYANKTQDLISARKFVFQEFL